jgi:hypothetical protein
MNLGSRSRRTLFLAGSLFAIAVLGSSCGRRTHTSASAHGDTSPTAAPVPTPDNTPIDVLRTPAGLALKTEDPTHAPGHEPTPATSPAPRVTP